MKICALRLALCASIILCSVQAGRAAEPLDSIPNTVAAVIRFESIDKFLGNANEMLGAIGPLAQVAGAELERNVVGEMFELKDGGTAIDRKANAYVAVFPIDRGGPPVAWFVQTKDESALRKSILRTDDLSEVTEQKAKNGFVKLEGSRTAYFGKRGKFVVYCLNENIVELLSSDTKPLALPADVVAELTAGDASLVVNASHLTQKFKSEIDGGKADALDAIEDLPEEQLGPNGPAVRKIYKQVTEQAFATLYDARFAVGRVNMSAAGVGMSGFTVFQDGSSTAKFLSKQKKSDLSNLGLLPTKAPIYAGFNMDLADFSAQWLKMNYGENVRNPEQMKKGIEEMAQGGVESSVISYAFPTDDKTGIMATMLEQAKDAKMLFSGWRKYLGAVGEVKAPGFSQKIEYKEKAETYKNRAIDLFSTQMKMDGQPEIQAVVGGLFKRMFGGEALQSRITIADNILVQATGNDPQLIRTVIDQMESGSGILALDKAYGKTRDKIDKNANVIVMLNLPQLVGDGVRMVKDIEPFNLLLATLPFNFETKMPPSYVGMSVTAGKNRLSTKIFVPVEQPKGIMQIFAPPL